MPTYVYRKNSGEIVELAMSISEKERRQRQDGTIVLDDGSIAERDFSVEQGGFRNTPGNWPLYSDAAGCHPDQVDHMQKEAARRGVPTDYTPDGRVIFRSRDHRRRFCEAFRFYDRNAGYGDPVPQGGYGQ